MSHGVSEEGMEDKVTQTLRRRYIKKPLPDERGGVSCDSALQTDGAPLGHLLALQFLQEAGGGQRDLRWSSRGGVLEEVVVVVVHWRSVRTPCWLAGMLLLLLLLVVGRSGGQTRCYWT